jgi:osmotically-inducible protein OsmY
MVRSSIVIAALAFSVACIGCGASTASQERGTELPARVDASATTTNSSAGAPAPVAVPDNPVDKGIRRDLSLAISRDADLKNRRINFIVANGDVSVSGTVATEEERRKINDLAMNVPGVKSVANALLIAQ